MQGKKTYDKGRPSFFATLPLKKIFRHAEYESARRDLNFFMGKELELLVFLLFLFLKEFESVWSTCYSQRSKRAIENTNEIQADIFVWSKIILGGVRGQRPFKWGTN